MGEIIELIPWTDGFNKVIYINFVNTNNFKEFAVYINALIININIKIIKFHIIKNIIIDI